MRIVVISSSVGSGPALRVELGAEGRSRDQEAPAGDPEGGPGRKPRRHPHHHGPHGWFPGKTKSIF